MGMFSDPRLIAQHRALIAAAGGTLANLRPSALCTAGRAACHGCGRLTALELLDGKPSNPRKAGEPWNRLECAACYGPGWCVNDWGQIEGGERLGQAVDRAREAFDRGRK